MLCHLLCSPEGMEPPPIHTLLWFLPHSPVQPSVIDTYIVAMQHVQKAMSQLLAVGTKVLT